MMKWIRYIALASLLLLPFASIASNGGAQHIVLGPYLTTAGVLYPSPKIYHYAAGTTTLKDCWSDETKVTPVAQPFIGDTSGVARMFCDGDYKFRVDDTAGNTLYTWDAVKVTSDTATMWEGNEGTAYPSASATNLWQLFAKHTSGNVLQEVGINDGTAFRSISGSALPAYTKAGLPTAGTAGRLARVTDNVRGIWLDTSTQWVQRNAQKILVDDFGAIGDGTTDDTAAFTTAITASKYGASYFWGAIELTAGKTYKITDTLTFSEMRKGAFIGNGATLTWAGAAGKSMFNLSDVRESTFSEFRVLNTTPLDVVFNLENGAGANVTPTENVFRHIYIEGNNTITDGFRIGVTGTDANNDNHSFYDVHVAGYTGKAWYLFASQARNLQFFGCHYAAGQYGVYVVRNGFSWFGGDGGGVTIADFYVDNVSGPINIHGIKIEGSKKFLITTGPSGTSNQLFITGISWDSSAMDADQKMMTLLARGPYYIIGNNFGTAPTQATPHIFWNQNTVGKIVVSGNTFVGLNASTETVFVGTPADSIQASGNLFWDTPSLSYTLANEPFNSTSQNAYKPVTIAADATTPSVKMGNLFVTSANTIATAITQFTGGIAGQIITVIGGSSTNASTLADAGNFKLTAAITLNLDTTITLVTTDGTTWREVSRSVN